MDNTAGRPKQRDEQLLRQIEQAISTVKHGCVELIVQDSRVIQINKTEKIRLDAGRPSKA